MKIKSAPPLAFRKFWILSTKGRKNVRHPGKQRQPPTMSSHDLQDECSGVTGGSRIDIIDGFADTMQGSRGTDG